MATDRFEVTVGTGARVEVVNITAKVAAGLGGRTLKEGLLCASVRHSTCAIVLNEDEAGLRRDLERVAATVLDPVRKARSFFHDEIDDNAQSHLTACLLGASVTVPVSGGRMLLGTWQSLLLVELDGPRSRKVVITLVG